MISVWLEIDFGGIDFGTREEASDQEPWDYCPSYISIAVILNKQKQTPTTKGNLDRKGFISSYSCSLSWREVKIEM